jgi:hypothetical protein
VIGALMLARYELFVFISPLLFRSHPTMLLPLKPELLVLIAPLLFMSYLTLRKFPYFVYAINLSSLYSTNLFSSSSAVFQASYTSYLRSHRKSFFPGVFPIYIRLIFFPLLWSIFAILAANTGQFTHPFWWAFLLLFPVLYFIIKFRELIKYVISKFKVIAFVTFLCLLIFVIVFWCIYNPDSVISKILSLSYLIIVVYFILLILFTVIENFISWIQDRIKWQKWLKIRPSSITAQELLNLIT